MVRRNLSFDEAAAAIGRGLDRPVFHVRVPEDQARQTMHASGQNEHLTEAFLKVLQAIESGLVRLAEARKADLTTPTTMEEFARDVLRPLVREPVMAEKISEEQQRPRSITPIINHKKGVSP